MNPRSGNMRVGSFRAQLYAGRTAEIDGVGKFFVRLLRRAAPSAAAVRSSGVKVPRPAKAGAAVCTAPGVAPMIPEAGNAAGLGGKGIDREVVVAAAARMGDMVGAAADRLAAPAVDDVEHQRRVRLDRRVQGRGRVARPGSGRRRRIPPGGRCCAGPAGGRCRR